MNSLCYQAVHDAPEIDHVVDLDDSRSPYPWFFAGDKGTPQIARLTDWANGIMELHLEHAEGLPLAVPVEKGVRLITNTLRLLKLEQSVVLVCGDDDDECQPISDTLVSYLENTLRDASLPSPGTQTWDYLMWRRQTEG